MKKNTRRPTPPDDMVLDRKTQARVGVREESILLRVETHLPRELRSPSHEEPTPSLRGRIPVLDGLRGLAILLVITYHIHLYGSSAGHSLLDHVYYAATAGGWTGVDLFFVLSGFLITGILYDSRKDPHYFRIFYARRTVRIFPLYYLSLVLFFWITPLAARLLQHPQFAPRHEGLAATFLAWCYGLNWYEGLRGPDVISRGIQHLWSLSIEEQFYMAWPFLVLILTRRRLMTLCLGFVAFSLVFRLAVTRSQLPFAAYYWTFSRVDALAIGALIALAARDPNDWKRAVKHASKLTVPALCGVALLMSLQILRPALLPSFIAGQVRSELTCFLYSVVAIFYGGCLTMAVRSRGETLWSRFLNLSFLRFFGKYSYCLYICHQPLIISLTKMGVDSDKLAEVLGSRLLGIFAFNAIVFAASISIALASWNLFEKQWLKLKDLASLQPATKASSSPASFFR